MALFTLTDDVCTDTGGEVYLQMHEKGLASQTDKRTGGPSAAEREQGLGCPLVFDALPYQLSFCERLCF